MTITQGLESAKPLLALAGRGTATALVVGDREISYAELDGLVETRARMLGSTRRLVLLECANELEPVVTYLAALRGRHPVLLVPGHQDGPARRLVQRMVARYDPDVAFTRNDAGWVLTETRAATRHDLHPDLAVLLSTSGSTGTPKLVRLSLENLTANATAIAGYLDLGPADRAATTLPFQYCYGLSVINSHLIAGASLWLTDQSVIADGFWADFVRAGATSFAGVPYTFDLLERSGTDWPAVDGLRQVTQAGGRMASELVRSIAARTRSHGADLFVMYGQTEATARMAYLPPDLAHSRPTCIGVPIKDGEFRLDDGELVYSGPNVMLGYAEHPEDLALGRTLTELRTGDLAVQHDDGLFEIVGRKSRMAKLFGVRLDLDHAERLLAEQGLTVRLLAEAERLRAFVVDPGEERRVVAALTEVHCLPRHAVVVQTLRSIPLTVAGKTDYPALAALPVSDAQGSADVMQAFAGVFGREVAPGDSFVSLSGDSLLYVETYVRLERLLGTVPPDWPIRTIAELSGRPAHRRRRWALLEVPVLLRAVAIVLVVGTHTELWDLMGGAHTLLVVYGFGLARFALSTPTRGSRSRALGRSVRELAIPVVLVLGLANLITGMYRWDSVFLLRPFFREDHWSEDWKLWFLESVTWSTLALLVLVALPFADRAITRFGFASALVVFGAALAVRFSFQYPSGHLDRYTVERTAWLVALGWLVHAARTPAQRAVVSVLTVLSLVGYFGDDAQRELLVIGGVLVLLWIPVVPVPRPLDRVVGVLASATLFVYLTHWQIYPHLEERSPGGALVASLAGGVVAWWLYAVTRRRVSGLGNGRVIRWGTRTAPGPRFRSSGAISLVSEGGLEPPRPLKDTSTSS